MYRPRSYCSSWKGLGLNNIYFEKLSHKNVQNEQFGRNRAYSTVLKKINLSGFILSAWSSEIYSHASPDVNSNFFKL